jgi:large subunit ribosomal protein L27
MLRALLRSFASKMQAGVTKKTKDSAGKRLGIKRFGGEAVHYNEILVRQRGFKWSPGYNVFVGRDHTLHSAVEGIVEHQYNPTRRRTVVSVVPYKVPERPMLPRVFNYHPEMFPDIAADNIPPSSLSKPRQTPKSRKAAAPIDKGVALAEPKYYERPVRT